MSTTPTFSADDLLADPSDLAVRLDDLTASDAIVLNALKRLSARFRSATDNQITAVTGATITVSGRGNSSLLLPVRPITALTSVTVSGLEYVEGYDFVVGYAAGILRRDFGWPDGLDNIVVVCDHGYATVPQDIQDAILDMAEVYCNMSAGIESVTTGSESVKIANSLINGGSLGSWNEVIAKYTIGGNGDRS
ncbi:hypothetical protein RN607_00685 [Demequina capsici]|uniref:Phage gp6-like head-tail connector protein n=1 Tax=Demequina capsici TaxID=3075620 RepID=A0AA96FC16_9MICO|nr:hypothetical protein [Demequina sp. PMTSA13]WNM27549.1 hypothetical protein RN607_00685 [Demequina sp. PMTSA13]